MTAGDEAGFFAEEIEGADGARDSGIESAETTGTSFSVGFGAAGVVGESAGGALPAVGLDPVSTGGVGSAAKRHTSSALSTPAAAKIHGARRRHGERAACGKIDVEVVACVLPCVASSDGGAAACGEDSVTTGS